MSKASEWVKARQKAEETMDAARIQRPSLIVGPYLRLSVREDGDLDLTLDAPNKHADFTKADALRVADWLTDTFGEGA